MAMNPGPYRAPGDVERDPTALERLLALVRFRKGIRAVQRTRASAPTYPRAAFLKHVAMVPLSVTAVSVAIGLLLLLLVATRRPGSVESFCRELPVGTPDRIARVHARARGFTIMTPAALSGFVVRGRRAYLLTDFCVVNVSAGAVTSSKYNEP